MKESEPPGVCRRGYILCWEKWLPQRGLGNRDTQKRDIGSEDQGLPDVQCTPPSFRPDKPLGSTL